MEKFQVIQPSALLVPYVKQYWFLTMENVKHGCQRLVPFGCAALTFHRGNRTYSSLEKDYMPHSYLCGVNNRYTDLVFSGNIDFICIVFQPAGTKAFFKTPLNELSNSVASLDVLDDPELCRLEEQLNNTTDNLIGVELIEQFLLRRLCLLDRKDDKRIDAVMNSIRQGETNLKELAETACLSYKQFKRTFTEQAGINPKSFLQIMRFRKLHHLLQIHTDISVAQLAYECDYYDKSHLIRELKEFTGFTPTRLKEACDPIYSGYHSLFRLAFVDLSSK